MRRLLFAALFSLFALPCDAQSNLALPSVELPNFAAFAAGGAFGQYLHIQGSAKPGDGGGGYFYRSGLVCAPDGLTILKDKSGNCFFLQNGTTSGAAYVASVAAMQAITSPSSTADVQTASYYAGLGKGAARYTWNSASTANDCLHVSVSGFATGRYVLRTDLQANQILATQCGAYYDSSVDGSTGHDDLTAQQAAFTAAYIYGLIVGPDPGITRVCGIIDPRPGVIKQGAGSAEVFQFWCGGASGFYFQAPVGSTTYPGFQLHNFSVAGNLGQIMIQANCTGGSAPCGFTDDGTTQGYIDGVVVDHISSTSAANEAGIYVQLSKCFHCVIRNNSFSIANTHCIQSVGSDFLLVEQNRVIGCNNSAGANNHAIDIETAGEFGNLNRVIQNDVLRTRGASDAYIYSNAKSVEIANNAIEDGSGDPGTTCNIKIDGGLQVAVHDNIPQANANLGDNFPICVNGDSWYSLDIYNNAIATGIQWGANFNNNGTVAYYVPGAVPAMRNHITHHNNTTENGFPMNTSGSGAVPPGDLVFDSTPDTFMGPSANNYGATVRVTSAGVIGTQSPAWLLPATAGFGSLITFSNPNQNMTGTMSVCIKAIGGAAGQQVELQLNDNGVGVATATVTLSGGSSQTIYCPAGLAHSAIATNAQVVVWNDDVAHGGSVYLAEVYIKNG